MTDKTSTAEREAFEAWHLAQYPQHIARHGETYKNAHVRCRWQAWQARASQPLPGAQEAVATHGWLYDWTHSSATGRPDETYTGFTKDEQHARKHDNCTPVYTAPQPALSAGWVMVPQVPTNGMTIAGANTLDDPSNDRSSWDLAENVYRAMLAAASLPPSPSMDGESNG